ncbi:MAG: NAD(P)-dependent oxidoreductase [Burkholderiaceae bacterium]|nr:NAD(P)-dependent oxidoreductase [Burkholderiaceae bacterium]
MRIAVVGLGEAGLCYAEAIGRVPDVSLALCERAPGDACLALADRLGIPVRNTPGAWVEDCDWVFSFVTGEASLPVAEAFLARMSRGAGIYADFTTASPSVMRQAARGAAERGIVYLDVAIMGAIALSGPGTPLLVAGAASPEWQALMESAGAPLTVIGEAMPGDASSLKLLRSAFTKGMEALTVEVLAAAERQGLRERFYDVVSDIDRGSLPRYLETLVQTHLVHAPRRSKEVAEVRRQFEAARLRSDVLPGVEAAFQRTVRALQSSPPGEASRRIEDAVAWVLRARAGDEP